MRRRFFAGLLCLCMALALLPLPALAAGGRAIQMGADGISAGDKIYFGKFTHSGTDYDVPWVVLADGILSQTTTAPNVLPLLSEYLLGTSKFRNNNDLGYYNFRISTNDVNSSVLKTTMEHFYDGANKLFTSAEQDVIADTTLTGDSMISGQNDLFAQKLFPISKAEAVNWGGEGGIESTIRIAKFIYDPIGAGGYWWQRQSYNYTNNPKTASDGSMAYCVGTNGRADYTQVIYVSSLGARPAFHLKKASVLFISAAADGKAGDGALAAVGTNGTDEWKLTLNDSARDTFTVTQAQVAFDGATVYVPYSGAGMGANDYVSAIIKDNSDDIKYYGRIARAAASGVAAIDLSGIAMNAGDTLHVFSEQYNGNNKTDYASALAAVTVPPANAYAVKNTLTHITSGNAAVYRMRSDTAGYTATLTADTSYALPASITVKVGGNTLAAGTGYMYDGASGNLTIPANKLIGNMEILAAGVVPPTISGDTAMTLPAGYAATSTNAYAIGGDPMPTVTKTSGSASITWNPATNKLDIAAGLGEGIYNVALTAANGAATDATHGFTLTVTAAPAYAIALESPAGTPLTAHAFPAQAVGYDPNSVPPLTVTVKNTGNQSTGDLAIGLSGGDPGMFSLSETTLPSIGAGGTAGFEVAVIGGYAPSTYNATVTVSAAPGNPNPITPKGFTVQFTVNNLPTAAAPTFNPAGGTYNSAQSVTLSCATNGAVIRYTTDGTEPTASSAVYSAPISVTVTTTVKAKAFKAGMNDSAMASATYTINTPGPVPPAPSSGSSSISGGGAYVGNQYAGSFTIGANGALACTVQASCPKLASVIVNGVQLAQGTDYTVTCGSTIITFTPAYLAALKDGAHTMRVQFTDGRYDGSFITPFSAAITSAPVPDVPATGDVPLWARILKRLG